MNKRRMKYKYWDNVRMSMGVLHSTSIFIPDIPPGVAYYGPTNVRTHDTDDGRGIKGQDWPPVMRPYEDIGVGREESCYSYDSTRYG